MKKTAVFILHRFLYYLLLKAQQAHLGVKGGLNISQLHFADGDISSDSKVGVNIGVFAHIHASKTWAIQPELLYSLEGAQKVGNCGDQLQFELF